MGSSTSEGGQRFGKRSRAAFVSSLDSRARGEESGLAPVFKPSGAAIITDRTTQLLVLSRDRAKIGQWGGVAAFGQVQAKRQADGKAEPGHISDSLPDTWRSRHIDCSDEIALLSSA